LKFEHWEQIDSQEYRNLNQVREGGFQKFHKFYARDLQTGEKRNPNKERPELQSRMRTRKFSLDCVPLSLKE